MQARFHGQAPAQHMICVAIVDGVAQMGGAYGGSSQEVDRKQSESLNEGNGSHRFHPTTATATAVAAVATVSHSVCVLSTTFFR